MTRQPLFKSHLFPVEPEVLVNIQQLNIEQPREVNFGLGKQYLESSKGAMAEKHKRRPNDKFLEAFYNRSVLLPPVLRKIISIQRLLRKSSQEDNDDIDIDTAAPLSCEESGRCLTQDNQTRSKQLDIDIQPLIDRDIQTNLMNHTDDTSSIAHGPDVGNKKEVRKENSDQNRGQTSPPSDKNIDTDTATDYNLDISAGYSILNDSKNSFRQDTSNKNKNSSVLRFGQQNISFVANMNGVDYKEVANLSTDASNKTSYDGFGEFESGYRSLRARGVLDGRVDLGDNQPLLGGGVQCLQDCSFESESVGQLNLLTPSDQDAPRQRDIAKVLLVLGRLLAKDTVDFLLAESLAPMSKKWRFVVNDVEVESVFLFRLRRNFRKLIGN